MSIQMNVLLLIIATAAWMTFNQWLFSTIVI